MRHCRECEAELVPGKNWAPSCAKKNARICRACKSEYDKVYHETHKEEMIAYRKAYREIHGDRLRKKSNEWHKENRSHVRAYRTERRERRSEILHRYKRIKGCLLCPERCSAVLDFHAPNGHIDCRPTTMLLSNWDRVKTEVFNCVVVCRNCHRKLHCGILELPRGAL